LKEGGEKNRAKGVYDEKKERERGDVDETFGGEGNREGEEQVREVTAHFQNGR